MNTIAQPLFATPRRNLLRLYTLEARSEFLKLLRLPSYALPIIGFPLVFYILFGLSLRPPGAPEGAGMATYLIASYGAFGVIGAALFGLGIGVSVERGQGWLLLKRATPMPLFAYLLAKMAMALIIGLVIVLLLAFLGITFGDVRLPAPAWMGLICTLVLGSIPFSAIGLALGFICGPNSAPGLVNLIYLLSSFASGLWIPITMLPGFLSKTALALPPYHLGQLAHKFVGSDVGQPAALHVGVLAVTTVISLFIAAVAFRRDRDQSWG